MAVLRKEKKSNFTVIDNAIFKDYTLSMKATGLLCKMLSLPDDWDYSIAGLTKIVNDGESAVRSTLKELEEAGYFRREQVRENGKIVKIEYVVSEYKNCEKPLVENPQQENLQLENHGQLNTNISNTFESTTKEYSYSDNKESKKIVADAIKRDFEYLWSLYPNKRGKQNAFANYERYIRKGEATYEGVLNGIKAYIAYIEANDTEERYIKHGSTFFHQKAWDDDWTVSTSKKMFGNDDWMNKMGDILMSEMESRNG